MALPRSSLPKMNYTARDFMTMKQALSDYIQLTKIDFWNDFFESEIGVALIDMLSYVSDVLNYHMDKKVNNLFPDTLETYKAGLKLAKLLHYPVTGAKAAKVQMTATNMPTLGPTDTLLIQGPKWNNSGFIPGVSIEIEGLTFETIEDIEKVEGSSPVFDMYEGKTYGDEFIALEGSDPIQFSNRKFQTFESLQGSVIDSSWKVEVETEKDSGVFETWTRAQKNSLIFAGADDKVYMLEYVNQFNVLLTFGDNINGTILPSGSRVRLTYRVGGGIAGNIFANKIDSVISTLLNSSVYSLNVQNLVKGVDGVDIESLASIKVFAPLWAQAIEKAISLKDFSTLVTKFALSQGWVLAGVSVVVPNNRQDNVGYVADLRGSDGSTIPNVKVFYPSYMCNIAEIYVWKFDTSTQTVEYFSSSEKQQLQDYLNLGNVDPDGVNREYDIGMVALQTFVRDGQDLNTTIVVNNFRADPVFDFTTVSTNAENAVKSLFLSKTPGLTLSEMEIWKAIGNVAGVLSFDISTVSCEGISGPVVPVNKEWAAKVYELFVLESISLYPPA